MITRGTDTPTRINTTRFSRARASSSTARTLCTSATRATGQPGSKLRFDDDHDHDDQHDGYGDQNNHVDHDDKHNSKGSGPLNSKLRFLILDLIKIIISVLVQYFLNNWYGKNNPVYHNLL